MDTLRSPAVLYLSLLLIHLATGFKGVKIKSTTTAGNTATGTEAASRRNTLLDDADDLQRQLDNEARERFRQHPKTPWILHLAGKPSTLARAARGAVFRKTTQERTSTAVDPSVDEENSTTDNPPSYKPPWYYSNMGAWLKNYPSCCGRAQSPVSVARALVRVRGARPLLFKHYDELPSEMTLRNDGTKLVLSGRWTRDSWPSLWGGAAHSRRYFFHSAELHWPSEHRVGIQQFPLELQAVHVAAEYSDFEAAINAVDAEALLIVSYLYVYGNVTNPPGVELLLSIAVAAAEAHTSCEDNPEKYKKCNYIRKSNDVDCIETLLENSKNFSDVMHLLELSGLSIRKNESDIENELFNVTEKDLPDVPETETEDVKDTPPQGGVVPSVVPLKTLFPVFKKDYATYAGSQTAPPCKEIVRWIIYSRPLTIQRDVAEAARKLRSVEGPMRANFRWPQPLNDRQIYYFY